MPEKAKEFSAEGLKAFAEFWYPAFNYATETGDVSLAQVMVSPECERCKLAFDDISTVYKSQGWVEGQKLQMKNANPRFQSEASTVSNVEVEYSSTPGADVSSDGTVKTSKGVDLLADVFFVEWSNGSWIITDVREPA